MKREARDRQAGFEKHLDYKMESLGYNQGMYTIDMVSGRPALRMNDAMSPVAFRELAKKLKPDFNPVVKGDTLVFKDVPNLWQASEELVKVAKVLVGSMQRHCAFYKAKDNKWYMELASQEYEEQRKATTYGPFESESEADHFLTDNFSNPGGSFTDDSGRKPVPTKSPNGSPVQNPKHHRSIWGTSASEELVKVAKVLVSRRIKLQVFDAEDENELGTVTLEDYEARHFLKSKSFPAGIALDDGQIRSLGIDEDTLIFFDEERFRR